MYPIILLQHKILYLIKAFMS